jgi:hypothetical protein
MQPSRPLLLVLFSGLLLALRIANAQGSESVAPAAANSPSPEPSKPIVPSIECGHWQKDYTARHAAMLRGEIPAKWAIATGPNGLAGGWSHRPTLGQTTPELLLLPCQEAPVHRLPDHIPVFHVPLCLQTPCLVSPTAQPSHERDVCTCPRTHADWAGYQLQFRCQSAS